jgi:cytochrome c oxidase assembly protein Cox11
MEDCVLDTIPASDRGNHNLLKATIGALKFGYARVPLYNSIEEINFRY